MEFLTAQEIFDNAKNHLIYQNRTSEDSSGAVRYYGEHGAKDPVGMFIPADLYHPSIEGSGVSLLNHEDVIEKSYLGQVLLHCGLNILNERIYLLLSDLQMIHDNFEPNAWHAELEKLAATYSLKFG